MYNCSWLANGKLKWLDLLNKFYHPFNQKYDKLKGNKISSNDEKIHERTSLLYKKI